MTQLLRTINPCYPRSGHRFLRNLCHFYFGHRLKFGSVHIDTKETVAAANYVKDHDFGLRLGGAGIPIVQNARYLVQYRHPLETAQSYFDFNVFHGQLEDSRKQWEHFLPGHLEYWKNFVNKWCLDRERLFVHRVRAVDYGTLHEKPKAVLSDVIAFLTGDQEEIDVKRVDAAITRYTGDFARYAEQEAEGTRPVSRARDISAFRYFDDHLAEIEQQLAKDYLAPLGLDRKLSAGDGAPANLQPG